ncbi:hypothetical protein KP509_16G039300 [Ceratopteris richardii]|uniref:J domain-containing protein n=1 Tax=Ceratopteris richardii TaxID=49495 RepID=A0A8T2SZL3_CERRI|nr:hypothetical protein KP509_16G039300 [Ceratopteris richardii]
MDCAAALLSPRSPSSFSAWSSTPSSPSSTSCSFSFSPSPSPRPLSSPRPIRSAADLDSSSSSIWGSVPRPFIFSLQDPPRLRFRPSAVEVSNYATTAEPDEATSARWGTTVVTPRSTHYSVLGVSPTSSPSEIRSAYRKLALKHHPDVSPLHQLDKATKIFAEINEAYTVLSDPQKRACYDLKLAMQSPMAASNMTSPVQYYSTPSPRAYTDASTGRVYPSMNSFYREWRRNHT